MKKIFITILIFGILLPPAVFAVDEKPLPILENEREANAMLRQSLIDRYGNGEFGKCLQCTPADTANPFACARCLRDAEYCLKGTEAPVNKCAAGQADSSGICVTADIGCKEEFGQASYFTGSIVDNHYQCECREGYSWNNEQTACDTVMCPDNMIYYSSFWGVDSWFLDGRCLSPDDACRNEFGEYSVYLRQDEYGANQCGCADGYYFEDSSPECVEAVIVAGEAGPSQSELVYIETLDRERTSSGAVNKELSQRLAGMFVLQVEEYGEAWYVDPADQRRYYLAGPDKAFDVMRALGLGATHRFISDNQIYPDYVLGRILIDVDNLGKAYYINPVDRRGYYLGNPLNAFSVMRDLGLGISNLDLRQIELGEL